MIFADPPNPLIMVTRFTIPKIQTWGSTKDKDYKDLVRRRANLDVLRLPRCSWYVFSLRCIVGQSRGTRKNQVPDVENIPKLIVDAFTGVLYPDDNLHYVRGVQVEAIWGKDEEEQVEISIWGYLT